MITFDTVSLDEMEAMCTPMHCILSPDPASSSSAATGALYLGSMAAMHDRDLLQEHKIFHIVQILEVPWQPQDEESTAFSYHRIDLEDNSSAALRSHLAAACDYIHTSLSRGENVLVHCQQGVSRSAAIVIAYLIREHAMGYDAACALVKARRACIRPNSGFVVVLRDWETACAMRSKSPISIPKVDSNSKAPNRKLLEERALSDTSNSAGSVNRTSSAYIYIFTSCQLNRTIKGLYYLVEAKFLLRCPPSSM